MTDEELLKVYSEVFEVVLPVKLLKADGGAAMNRRGFLSSCLALAAAPAIVRAESLMRVVVPSELIVHPGSRWHSLVWLEEPVVAYGASTWYCGSDAAAILAATRKEEGNG